MRGEQPKQRKHLKVTPKTGMNLEEEEEQQGRLEQRATVREEEVMTRGREQREKTSSRKAPSAWLRSRGWVQMCWEALQGVILSDVIFFFKQNHLFLVELGLCGCVRAFANCSERKVFFDVVASLVTEHGL